MSNRISTTQQKVDQENFNKGWDAAFGHDRAQEGHDQPKKDVCKFCHKEEHNDICEGLLQQQVER